MRRLTRSVFILLTCATLFVACRSAVVPVKASGEAPVALNPAAKRTEHSAKVANRITVTLPATNPATQVWAISFHDARYLRQTTDIVPPSGSTAAATVSFLALQPTPGRTTRVRFVLLPAESGREATPIDTHDLVLKID